MAVDDEVIPETGAVFSFGKSRFAENIPSKFWIRNDPIAHLSCGDEHTAVVTESGRVFVFGSNDSGQLGQRYPKSSERPICIKALKHERILRIACGKAHTIVATESGKLYGFGANDEDQLGVKNVKELTEPKLMSEFNSVQQVDCGAEISVVLTNDGILYLFGKKLNRDPDENDETNITPLEIKLDLPVISVSCGYYHVACVTSDGKLFLMTEKDSDKEESNNFNSEQLFDQVMGIPEKVMKVACGGKHTAALTVDGKLYTFGDGTNGELGLGTRKLQSDNPELVSTLEKLKLKDVVCGESHTCVVTENGTMFVFGDGRHGKLGVGTENFSNQFRPIKVLGFKDFKVEKVACGGCHTMVLAKVKTPEEITSNYVEDIEPITSSSRNSPDDVNLSARHRRHQKELNPAMKLPPLKLPGKQLELNEIDIPKEEQVGTNLIEVEQYKDKKLLEEIASHVNEKPTNVETENVEDEQDETEDESQDENEKSNSSDVSEILQNKNEAKLENEEKDEVDEKVQLTAELKTEESANEVNELESEEEEESVADDVVAFENKQITIQSNELSTSDLVDLKRRSRSIDSSASSEESVDVENTRIFSRKSSTEKELDEESEILMKSIVESSEIANSIQSQNLSSSEKEGKTVKVKKSSRKKSVEFSESEESEIEESEITTEENFDNQNKITKSDMEVASAAQSTEVEKQIDNGIKKKKGNLFNRIFGISKSPQKPKQESADDQMINSKTNENDNDPTEETNTSEKQPVPSVTQSTLLCLSSRKVKRSVSENVEESNPKPTIVEPISNQPQSVTCLLM